MKSHALGQSTSTVEILNVSPHGLWLWVRGGEFLLPYEDYPWFRDAKISEVYNVQLLRGNHLYWPDLDVDLELESLERPEQYPLKFQK